MRATIAILLCLSLPQASLAWGEKGHVIVNRLAMEAAGDRLPPFMMNAADYIAYNSYEPDRWREETNSPMHAAQAPDHFFDSEYWGPITTIEADRYAFMSKLTERGIELARVGYLPYAILENYGRLRNAFRQWRNARNPEEREFAKANAVYYAGLLGHYVGDGSQPLHLSIHFNGWSESVANPNNYSTDRGLHSRFEIAFVNMAVDSALVKPKVQSPQRLQDVFASVKTYLAKTYSELQPLYELEKAGEFNPEAPRTKGKEFIASQLARSATMLGDLWYTAWLESGVAPPAARK